MICSMIPPDGSDPSCSDIAQEPAVTTMEVRPLVRIVILNWNGWRDTNACLDTLRQLDYPRFAVTVVDNASSDGSPEHIRQAHPDICLLLCERNLGFAEGNNVGIRHALDAGAEYVWLLNNDTLVAPDSLERLIHAMEADRSIGVVGPKVYYVNPPDAIWYAGARFRPWFGQSIMLGNGEKDDGRRWETQRDVAFISGCAMLIRAEVLRDVGLLDANYFFLIEDLDYGLRVSERGLRNVVVPGSHIWHRVSSSSGGSESPLALYYLCRNRLLLMRKHGQAIQWPSFLLHFSASSLIQYAVLVILGRRPIACLQAVLLGTMDFCRGRFGLAPQSVQRTLARPAAK